ncbi:hypothetical protein TSAR_009184 [Trichomalopsis sarcophagae]|uniref:Uncharacterized protein n=1 Tax=Trichomalopsis sarcophagae TaxID=543379 RepID=A0A232FFD1_9HYME|nr:hypothetical protein TSAR_009184 [Trichomalopsis sarcophagae]
MSVNFELMMNRVTRVRQTVHLCYMENMVIVREHRGSDLSCGGNIERIATKHFKLGYWEDECLVDQAPSFVLLEEVALKINKNPKSYNDDPSSRIDQKRYISKVYTDSALEELLEMFYLTFAGMSSFLHATGSGTSEFTSDELHGSRERLWDSAVLRILLGRLAVLSLDADRDSDQGQEEEGPEKSVGEHFDFSTTIEVSVENSVWPCRRDI